MNKMHTTAKIAAGILGIYLLIFTVLTLIRNLSFMFMYMGKGNMPSLMAVAAFLCITLGFVGAVFYFLIYRSDLFANKIVGKEELPDVECTFNWFPFAMRLTAVVVGFLFLEKAIVVWDILISHIGFIFKSATFKGMDQVHLYGVIFLIYLAVSVYLLCGAPHFVRWQVKKTIEMCKEFSEKQGDV